MEVANSGAGLSRSAQKQKIKETCEDDSASSFNRTSFDRFINERANTSYLDAVKTAAMFEFTQDPTARTNKFADAYKKEVEQMMEERKGMQ